MTIYHGTRAVWELEKAEGITLTEIEHRTVMCEGYATEPYPDSDDPPTLTNKVGQTGEWLHKPFREAFEYHVKRAQKRIPDLLVFPGFLQAELIQAEYRGDLGLSPKACQFIRWGQWRKGAVEFLNHAEYQNPKTPQGIKDRIEAVHYALMLRAMHANDH
jgi:hypothetical protein